MAKRIEYFGVVFTLSCSLMFGCAGRRTIKVNSNPSGANVVFDGKTYSNTPSKINVKKDGRDHYLFLNKKGCAEARKVFRNNEYPKKVLVNLQCEEGQPAFKSSMAQTSEDQAARLAEERQRALEEERLRNLSLQEASADQEIIDAKERFMNEDIYFDYDSSFLTGQAHDILKRKALWLQENPDVTVIIQGHTDERGTNEYNLALGERRAESTRDFLINLGIITSRLMTVSLGEEYPVDLGHSEEGWAKNRRAHFVIE